MDNLKIESVEDFLARGGKVNKCKVNESGFKQPVFRSEKKTISPQALLDAAVGTPQEQEVINFLKTQGFQVEGE